MARTTIFSCCCAVLAASAHGEIREWGNAQGGYEIRQDLKTVRIFAAGTYKFESVTSGELDDINKIWVEPAVAGTVELYVERQGGGDGARALKELNLSGAEHSEIKRVQVSEGLGELGSTVAESISGPVWAGAGIYSDIIVAALEGSGSVSCPLLDGDLTVTGAGPHGGTIHVTNLHLQTISISG